MFPNRIESATSKRWIPVANTKRLMIPRTLQSAKIVPWKKCIFDSSLKNTETQQGGHHGEASIGSAGTAMVQLHEQKAF